MPPKKGGPSRQRVPIHPSSAPPPVPANYPGKIDGKGMEEYHWNACRNLLEGVYNAKDAEGRKISEIFRELPDRQTYADYYEAIPEPECLDNISRQLGLQAYESPEDLFKQLHLVFLNAKHYNEEGSGIWEDAKTLEDKIFEDWRARAAQNILPHPDPYHRRNFASKPIRKKDRGGSANTRGSVTPAAEVPVEPSLSIRLNRPAVAPIPPKMPRPTPPNASLPLPNINSPAAGISNLPSSSPAETQERQRQIDNDLKMIADLEATLPKWNGPQEVLPGPPPGGIEGSGWFGEGGPSTPGGSSTWPRRIKAVIIAVVGYREASGFRLAEVLDMVPEESTIPYLSFTNPLSLNSIHSAALSSRYTSLIEFDMDMVRLFEKARRFFPDKSVEYGHVLTLQRLHNALTAPYPLPLPPSGIPDPSPTHFSSLPAGPGNARSMHETNQELRAGASEGEVGFGLTTFRVGTRDRVFTEEARHKGQTYRLGDYVHMINPDDATRPIIGQIFKTFIPTKGYRTHHATVCWYYRPEQTVHTPDRLFFEREVFKTGHFCDHPVQDIIERVSCQFYTKFIRGRPQAPEFYPGWPIYVCNSRYNDKEYLAVKIKNWNSCIPDELRQSDFMSIVPYERQRELPLVKSPLFSEATGPGFFAEPKKADDEDGVEKYSSGKRETRLREQYNASIAAAPPSVPPPQTAPLPQMIPTLVPRTGPSGINGPFDGRPSALPPATAAAFAPPPVPIRAPIQLPQQQRQISVPSPQPSPYPRPQYSTPSGSGQYMPPPGSGTGSGTRAPVPQTQRHAQQSGSAQQGYQRLPQSSSSSSQPFQAWNGKGPKSLANVMGGPQMMDTLASKELLPSDTAKLFERDSKNQVLWFSGPPLPPGTVEIPMQPYHSLEYLTYLSKRKRGDEEVSVKPRKSVLKDDGSFVGIGNVGEVWWMGHRAEGEVLKDLTAVIDSVSSRLQ